MYRFCGRYWSCEEIERIKTLMRDNPSMGRCAISRQICEELNWRKHDGLLKDMSCRVALLKMERSELIQLPPRKTNRKVSKGIFESPDSDPKPLREITLKDLPNISVELISSHKKHLRLWNEFVSRYHYLGYKMLPGAQLRYLIMSDGEILGAMGFGAAAWKVQPRDTFIGWTAETREKNLHLIINQSRFLILPWIQCKNLATKSLSLVSKRISNDWEARYCYRPVLMETFVDTTKFAGICYKAGNWINVGLTQGRGKIKRDKEGKVPVKSIWLMPLCTEFRSKLLKAVAT
jgi:hypothetical protein